MDQNLMAVSMGIFLQELSKSLERILDASSHELNDETVIIVAR